MCEICRGRREKSPTRRGVGGAFSILLLLLVPASLFAATPIVDGLSYSADGLPPGWTVPPGATVVLQVDAHNPTCPDSCTSGCGLLVDAARTGWTGPPEWLLLGQDDGSSSSPYTATSTWQAPLAEGSYTFSVDLADNTTFLCGGSRQWTSAELILLVTATPTQLPIVEGVAAAPQRIFPGETSTLSCTVTEPDGDPFAVSWAADRGTVMGTGATASFSDASPGAATVTCTATDVHGASSSASVSIGVTEAKPEAMVTKGLAAPHRVAADGAGTLFVADTSAGGITVTGIGGDGWLYRLPLSGVTSVAVDWFDRLVVGGSGGAMLLDRFGTILQMLRPGEVPTDVAVDPVSERFGLLYGSAGRVVVLDGSGGEVVAFGSVGDGADQLKSPSALAFDLDGNLLVADRGHGRILRFDPTGSLLQSIGTPGGGVGEFIELDDVAAGPEGRIFATDSYQSWIQSFAADGSPLEAIGTHGDELGQLRTPAGIAWVQGLGRLVVASSNGSRLQVFELPGATGSLPLGRGEVAPGALDFGALAVGTTSGPLSVLLSNSGDGPLGIQARDVSPGFSVSDDCGEYLDGGASCTLEIVFAPTTFGSFTGTLRVETAGAGVIEVSLSGTAFLPAQLVTTPVSLAFPDVAVGSVSSPLGVSVHNPGTVALALTGLSVDPPFLATPGCGSSLAGGATCVIAVELAPTLAGPVTGSLQITSDAGMASISLTGTGLTPAAGAAVPGVLVFSAQPVGSTSAARDVTVVNTGSLPLSVGSVAATGPFGATSRCPGLLEGGSACPVSVVFSPASAGPAIGQLTVVTGAGELLVALSGEGDDGTAQVELGLSLTESDDPVFGGSGVDRLEHLLTVFNEGTQTATGIEVEVSSFLPTGVDLVEVQPSAGSWNGSLWSLPDLQGIGSATLLLGIEAIGDPQEGVDVVHTSASIVGADQTVLPDGDESAEIRTSIADGTPPSVLEVLSGPDPIERCRVARKGVTQLTVAFDEPVQDPPGDYLPGDVTNTDSYRLYASGPDHRFDSAACGPALKDDRLVPFRVAAYTPESSLATLEVNQGEILPDSLYRLMVCGTISSIRDLEGNGLDGDGDGEPGGDHQLTFRVDRLNLFDNGHFDCDLDGWTLVVADPEDITHSALDRHDSDLSGSVAFFGHVPGGSLAIGQCLQVFPRVDYTFDVAVRFESLPPAESRLAMICDFYGSASCGGDALGSAEFELGGLDVPRTGSWFELEAQLTSPEQARSAVCFVASEPAGGLVDAHLDVLRLTGEGPLFLDGFESGDASAWSRSSDGTP